MFSEERNLPAFDYTTAFQRNLGFISAEEQLRLRRARIAIAGLGGTGGAQAQALARMGIGGFTLADPDTFELANFNRQTGAFMSTIGRGKAEVAAEIIQDINPEAKIRLFEQGIDAENIDAFLEGANVVVDSLDFYCFEERFLLYRKAREHGLWVLTAPPLGFGFTLLCFDPNGMSFERYFGFHPGMAEHDLVVALVAGLAPRPYILRYLKPQGADLKGRRLPSVGAAPFMIAGVIATEVTQILLKESKPLAVPTIYQFDARLRCFKRQTLRWGMNSPWQRFKRWLLSRKLSRQSL
ncbi:MAG: ThiF family adenylyltransferase [Methylohalobius crimeensis]